jgi:alanine dehydrogenase
MNIGVPKECKNNEFRVALVPHQIAELSKKHPVWVQKDAGIGSGFTNEDYIQAGAKILNQMSEVYAKADLIVKVKEPLPEEYPLIRADQIVFTYFHFASSLSLTKAMQQSGACCIAYETIEDKNGQLPLLTPMSAVAGRLAGQQAAKYLEMPQGGPGILIGGVDGVAPAKVLVLGGGIVGTQATEVLVGMGADVFVFDINTSRLEELTTYFDGKITPVVSTAANLQKHLPTADAIIGAVLVKGAKAPKLITREMLRHIKPKSVLVDVAVDQGGCFETTKPTTHQAPIYEVDGIVHYAVANMPGAVPQTSTKALTNATFDYVMQLADTPVAALPELFLKGVNMYKGKITNREVADAFALPYSPLENILT